MALVVYTRICYVYTTGHHLLGKMYYPRKVFTIHVNADMTPATYTPNTWQAYSICDMKHENDRVGCSKTNNDFGFWCIVNIFSENGSRRTWLFLGRQTKSLSRDEFYVSNVCVCVCEREHISNDLWNANSRSKCMPKVWSPVMITKQRWKKVVKTLNWAMKQRSWIERRERRYVAKKSVRRYDEKSQERKKSKNKQHTHTHGGEIK